MDKKLLQITIFEDINKPHEVVLTDKVLHTNQQLDLFEVIRQVIQTRLDVHHEKFMNDMKEKGALKTV